MRKVFEEGERILGLGDREKGWKKVWEVWRVREKNDCWMVVDMMGGRGREGDGIMG